MNEKIETFKQAQDLLVAIGVFLDEKTSLIKEQHGDDYAKRVPRCINALLDVCEHTFEQTTLEG